MNQHQAKSADYLRILTSGITGREDYALAAELIDGGYASGQVLRNNIGASTPFARVTLEALTTKGRALVDELREQARSAARRLFLIRCAMLVIASFIGLSLGVGLKRGDRLDRFEPVSVATKAQANSPQSSRLRD